MYLLLLTDVYVSALTCILLSEQLIQGKTRFIVTARETKQKSRRHWIQLEIDLTWAYLQGTCCIVHDTMLRVKWCGHLLSRMSSLQRKKKLSDIGGHFIWHYTVLPDKSWVSGIIFPPRCKDLKNALIFSNKLIRIDTPQLYLSL